MPKDRKHALQCSDTRRDDLPARSDRRCGEDGEKGAGGGGNGRGVEEEEGQVGLEGGREGMDGAPHALEGLGRTRPRFIRGAYICPTLIRSWNLLAIYAHMLKLWC